MNDLMWENLKVYKQLDKKDVNPTFKKLGKDMSDQLPSYSFDQTNSMIKLWRVVNQLEQAIFIEKSRGSYDLSVRICIKPNDFYRLHKYSMVNIVPLGDIMNNYRRSFYPLTKEWKELSAYLATRINDEIEKYFSGFNSYEKIISRRKEVEPKDFGIDNKYELLLYAAIKTRNQSLVELYIDKKLAQPSVQISHSEYLKGDNDQFDETVFLKQVKELAQSGNFESIEEQIRRFKP